MTEENEEWPETSTDLLQANWHISFIKELSRMRFEHMRLEALNFSLVSTALGCVIRVDEKNEE